MSGGPREPLRVLHCPLNTAGNPAALARAERELGLRSWAVAWAQSPFAFPCDEILWLPGMSQLDREARRRDLFLRAVRDYDVIHFNWGESIFPMYYPSEQVRPAGRELTRAERREDRRRRFVELLDVPLLRAMGKVIAVTFQGDDARQGDYIRKHFEISPAPHVGPDYYSAETDAWKRANIEVFGRFAHLIYAVASDVLEVLPRRAKFMRYATVDPRGWVPRRMPAANAVPVVAHAPTNREVKGTRFLLDAVARLKAEGVPFEFLLVENLPHEEAKACYRRADLLVDQLLVGNYGALAVELMALRTPAISYMREQDLNFLPEAMRRDMPVINADPSTIYDVLRSMLTTRRGELPRIGERSRAFVERWYDPRTIAAETAADYEHARSSRKFVAARAAFRCLAATGLAGWKLQRA